MSAQAGEGRQGMLIRPGTKSILAGTPGMGAEVGKGSRACGLAPRPRWAGRSGIGAQAVEGRQGMVTGPGSKSNLVCQTRHRSSGQKVQGGHGDWAGLEVQAGRADRA